MTNNMAGSTPPKWAARVTLKTAAAVVAVFCEFLKLKTGGWFTLMPGLVFYPALGLLHYYCHSGAINGAKKFGWSLLALLVGSHLLLIVGFLLQYDMGDGLDWLTITALMGKGPGYEDSQPPSWWPSIPFMSLWVFVPVFVTWGFLIMRRPPTRVAEGVTEQTDELRRH